MSTGGASVFSPASQPLFTGQLVRNPTRVNLAGGGGVGEFPFQWSWPGLVNYTAAGEGIPSIAGVTLNYAYYTVISGGLAVTVGIYINGVFQTSFLVSSNGSTLLSPAPIAAPGDVVGIAILDVGAGNITGLWVGLTPLIP